MYITNRPEIALIAERSGVDRIFIDLESKGKELRQGNLDTVKSKHQIGDIRKVKEVLTRSEVLVRVNPMDGESAQEIRQVIDAGADIIMLPYFTSAEEVERFLDYTRGKVKTCLLVETPGAVEQIERILQLPGIDCIHIGLNDLHLGYDMKFMFELLADGTVDRLCRKFRDAGIPYGFGGIARLGLGALNAEHVIAEHYRLGSTMAILSRSFCNADKINGLAKVELIFRSGMQEIRTFEGNLMAKDPIYFEENRQLVVEKVQAIVSKMAPITDNRLPF